MFYNFSRNKQILTNRIEFKKNVSCGFSVFFLILKFALSVAHWTQHSNVFVCCVSSSTTQKIILNQSDSIYFICVSLVFLYWVSVCLCEVCLCTELFIHFLFSIDAFGFLFWQCGRCKAWRQWSRKFIIIIWKTIW